MSCCFWFSSMYYTVILIPHCAQIADFFLSFFSFLFVSFLFSSFGQLDDRNYKTSSNDFTINRAYLLNDKHVWVIRECGLWSFRCILTQRTEKWAGKGAPCLWYSRNGKESGKESTGQVSPTQLLFFSFSFKWEHIALEKYLHNLSSCLSFLPPQPLPSTCTSTCAVLLSSPHLRLS